MCTLFKPITTWPIFQTHSFRTPPPPPTVYILYPLCFTWRRVASNNSSPFLEFVLRSPNSTLNLKSVPHRKNESNFSCERRWAKVCLSPASINNKCSRYWQICIQIDTREAHGDVLENANIDREFLLHLWWLHTLAHVWCRKDYFEQETIRWRKQKTFCLDETFKVFDSYHINSVLV